MSDPTVRETICDDVRSGMLIEMYTSRHIYSPGPHPFARSRRSSIRNRNDPRSSTVEPKSRCDGHWQSQWTARCLSELWTARAFGSRVSQTWQEWSRGKGENGKGQGKKGKPGKGKSDVCKEKGKGKGNTLHARHLKVIPITVGNDHVEGLFHKSQNQGGV